MTTLMSRRSGPTLSTYQAHEYDAQTMMPTGRVEHYMAVNHAQAVQNVLYTRRLKDGNAFVGPSGGVVYSQGKAYAVADLSGR